MELHSLQICMYILDRNNLKVEAVTISETYIVKTFV